jgi:hypothetical protein
MSDLIDDDPASYVRYRTSAAVRPRYHAGVPNLKRLASLPIAKGAAPIRDTTKQELLRSAVDSAGLRDVSRVTMASPDVVEGWMNGQTSMPDGKIIVLAVFLEKLGAND